MSLPSPWTDRIFAKLAVTYGQRFLGLYAGLDLQAVKDDWGHELRAYAQSPNAIAHALENLPTEKPPTVLEFRALCRMAPQYIDRQLEGPKVPPERMREAVAGIAKPEPKFDNKAWAKDLQKRELNGANLTLAQRQMWRAALGVQPQEGS